MKDWDGNIQELEHWTDAKFITIYNHQVYTQIEPIYEQSINFSNSNAASNFLDGKPNGWVAIISTSGVMRQRYRDILQGTEGMSEKEIKKMVIGLQTMKVKTKWASYK